MGWKIKNGQTDALRYYESSHSTGDKGERFTIHQKQCSLRSNRDSNWKRKCWVLESATLLKISVRSKQTHFSIAKIFYNFTSCQLTTISPADKVRNLLGYFLAWLLGRPEEMAMSVASPPIYFQLQNTKPGSIKLYVGNQWDFSSNYKTSGENLSQSSILQCD